MAMKDISDVQVCTAVKCYSDIMRETNFQSDIPYPYQFLATELGQPEKVCYRATERALRRGYIEFGVSLRTGWLTRKGLELIRSPEAAPEASPNNRADPAPEPQE